MLIKVKVYPEFNETRVSQVADNSFEVYVKARPQRGMATREAKELLADYLKVDFKQLRLIKGARTRNKIFKLYETNH